MASLPDDGQLPNLPAEVWGAIARGALLAEGSDVSAWWRLSLVSRACRAGVAGQDCKACGLSQHPHELVITRSAPAEASDFVAKSRAYCMCCLPLST